MAEYTYDGSTLQKGSRDSGNNKSVSQMQQALTDLGYDVGGVDGVFGDKTDAALRQYQSDVTNYSKTDIGGADGVLGAKTGAALQASVSEKNNTDNYLASNQTPTTTYNSNLEQELANYKSAQAKQTQDIENYYAKLEEQQKAQNDYSTQQSINALQRQWDDSINTYNQERAKTAYSAAQATDNMVLRNKSAGDLGGIGNKLYNDQQAAYDSAMLNIDLEQANLKNDIDRQVQDYIAQGDYANAQAALELGIQKMAALTDQSNNYYNTTLGAAQTLDSYNTSNLEAQIEYLQEQLKEAQAAKKDSGNIYTNLRDKYGATTEQEAYAELISQDYGNAEALQLASYYVDWLNENPVPVVEDDTNNNEEPDYTNKQAIPEITNTNSYNWVLVPGIGRVSYQELQTLVDTGKVYEFINADGTHTYSSTMVLD